MSYEPHRRMTDPARPSRDLWRLLVGLVLGAVVWIGLARGIMALVGSFMEADAYMSLLERLQTGGTPGSVLLLLLLTGTLGVGAMLAAQTVHGRAALGLFGPWSAFRRDFGRVAASLVALNLVIFALPPWDLYSETVPGLPLDRWMLFLPATVAVLLIQTGAEEVYFRGYFQSQLAARLRHPVIWLGVPSVVFGVGHYAPAIYGENALTVALWSVVFGVAAADLTARAGNLGPAVALHFINNFIAFALISLSGDMSGLALRQLPFGPEDTQVIAALLPMDLAMILVSWLAARVALRR